MGVLLVVFMISIHAPAKGATFLAYLGVSEFSISIHAPAKGATLASIAAGKMRYNFNPRSREGSDAAVLTF